MVDGVLLLVDASEGPLPQTRFVLRKALEAKLPVILVVNKVDRPDARIAEVVDEVYELFLDLDADSEQIDFPIVYTNAKAGWASLEEGVEGTDLSPLLDLMLERIPAPEYEPDHPLQAHVTNLDASPYVGRLALCRVRNGTIRAGQQIAWCRADGTIERATVSELYVTEALERVAGRGGRAGRIIAVAGMAEVTIGETLADPEDPRPLPVITVDEPSLSIVRRDQHLAAGRHRGHQADRAPGPRPPRRRAGRQRLDPRPRHRAPRRLGGPGPRRAAARRPAGADAPRGLRADRRPAPGPDPRDRRQAARAGRAAGDRRPRGATSAWSPSCWPLRKGRLEQMVNHSTGWVRMEYLVPARGLIGFRTEFLTETRGTGILHHVFDRWEPWAGELRTRPTGALVADRRGTTASFALFSLQERGTLFVGPGEEVYEGMIVGENARAEDLDVNAIKEKHQTNVRAASADLLVRLAPATRLSLERRWSSCATTSASR